MIKFTLPDLAPSPLTISKFINNYKPHFDRHLRSKDVLDQLCQYAQKTQSNDQHISIVGMGGSSLGLKALCEALDLTGRVTFFDNVDAFSFEKKINTVSKKNNHWFVISKSGSTQEVHTLLDFIIQLDSDCTQKMTVITTDNENPLRLWADNSSVPVFFIPEDVGGRYSVFTPVGLLPLLFLDQKVEDVKEGVTWALQQRDLISDLSNSLYQSVINGDYLHLYWFYSDTLMSSGLWLQQLWMESLSKKKTLSGESAPPVSSLFLARGSSDQHSLLQEVAAGRKNKLVTFISDERSVKFGQKLKSSLGLVKHNLSGFALGELLQAQCIATNEALQAEGVKTMSLHFEEVSLKSVSAFMTLYMVSVVAIANEMNIDPLNQPGVESSKEITKKILSRLKL